MKNYPGAKFHASLLGLAIGDALGAAVEFMPPGTFEMVTGFRSGGRFDLDPGQWTDDTSMALCLAESLIECSGFDPGDQMDRYMRWLKDGYLSSKGECFGIGITTFKALTNYRSPGDPFSGPTHERSAGNGSLMRLASIPLFYVLSAKTSFTKKRASTSLTDILFCSTGYNRIVPPLFRREKL